MSKMLGLMALALVATSAAAQGPLPASSGATASGGKAAAAAISATGTAFQQAAAVGYKVNTFHTGRWNPTQAIGFPARND